MPRAITGRVHKKRVKTVLKRTKGFRSTRSKLYRVAKNAMMRALRYSYFDRKQKKRVFRKLWIARINAACRNAGISYSQLIYGLTKAGVVINRKLLANLAIEDIQGFNQLVEKAKKAIV